MVKKSVSVVLSSYNGEKYLRSQIDSILAQKDVQLYLHIRDDGSKDDSTNILSEYSERFSNVSYEVGDNIGYTKSFLTALKNAPKADFYAFADQDDVWDEFKIAKTIKLLNEKEMCLAYCNAVDTDDNLVATKNHYSIHRKMPYAGMTFLSSVCSGFLMVFDEKIRKKTLEAENIIISHDLWVGALASYIGTIEYTTEALALHRRLENSVSRYDSYKTIKHRLKTLFFGKSKCDICAKQMLELYRSDLPEKYQQLLLDMANYKSNIAAKFRLIKNNQMRYSLRFGRLAIVLKILMNKF